MLRFVGRTQRTLDVLRSRLDALRSAIPEAVAISVNLLPEHKAVLEGEREEMLFGSSLTIELGGGTGRLPADPARPTRSGPGSGSGSDSDGATRSGTSVALHLLPRSFFQTNSEVAAALYAQAAEWMDRCEPSSIWDLYCGVGGFALHCASTSTSEGRTAARDVLGVEISESAVRSAERSAREAGLDARFIAQDATSFALSAARDDAPEAVIVNPPRRGIGPELAGWLEEASVRQLIYSSCNPESLARDLEAMPSYEVREARVFDMFPHTTHMEVMLLLERR
ncbi:methyltransferase domain-containing protein [Leucobacter zeae]|nr:methyltransferase domain-containing protein [Leucobacter zeae]